MMKIEGSGSISQRHGSADPDPDPHQNDMDPQHWCRREEVRADLELVLAHEPGVHQVLEVGKAFLHPEADRPHGHAVGQQHVPAHIQTGLKAQNTYICRVQSCAWRLHKPTPLSTQRVCPPPAPKAGGYTLAGR
jgi:hypothetical protein